MTTRRPRRTLHWAVLMQTIGFAACVAETEPTELEVAGSNPELGRIDLRCLE